MSTHRKKKVRVYKRVLYHQLPTFLSSFCYVRKGKSGKMAVFKNSCRFYFNILSWIQNTFSFALELRALPIRRWPCSASERWLPFAVKKKKLAHCNCFNKQRSANKHRKQAKNFHSEQYPMQQTLQTWQLRAFFPQSTAFSTERKKFILLQEVVIRQ